MGRSPAGEAMTLFDSIITQYLPRAFTFGKRLRAYLFSLIGRYYPAGPTPMLNALSTAIRRSATGMAATLKDSLIASWAGSAYGVSKAAFLDDDEPPHEPPKILLSGGSNLPGGFLFHERGIDWLESQHVIPSGMAHRLGYAAGRSAEVIAHASTEKAAQQLSGALAKALREGGTIRNFKAAVGEELDGSPLSDSQLETLYRTNGGRVYAAGQQAVLSHPIVGSEFPFVLYSATHDSRVRHDHLQMEHLGQNNTAVYRADDPVIRRYWAPWSWNCRCHCVNLSIADAARHGSHEAQRWLETGVPPARPDYVPAPPFDLPRGWVPVNGWTFPTPVV